MAQEYLPAPSNVRLADLMKEHNIFRKYCYHQTVKEYKSNGSLIRSKTDYYQAIGG